MRQSKRVDVSQEVFEEIWDAPRFAELVETVANSQRFKSAPTVQTLMRQMNALANPSSTASPVKVNGAAKRKVNEQEADATAKPHRKKVKKSKD